MAIPGDFDLSSHTFAGRKRAVLVTKTAGPPVIVMHEIFGLTEKLIEFCRMIANAGFRVHAPALFGSSTPKSGAFDKALRLADFLCVGAEFRVLQAGESGPWADWLRDLAETIAAGQHVPGVGVIGLCLTGNFALSMALSPKVVAAVMGEPSLPLLNSVGLHLTADELKEVKRRIAEENFLVRGYRYETDTICPRARFTAMEAALGDGFAGTNLKASEKLHSVFTEHLRDRDGALRHDKVQEVIGYLTERLK